MEQYNKFLKILIKNNFTVSTLSKTKTEKSGTFILTTISHNKSTDPHNYAYVIFNIYHQNDFNMFVNTGNIDMLDDLKVLKEKLNV